MEISVGVVFGVDVAAICHSELPKSVMGFKRLLMSGLKALKVKVD